jgi:transposase-like protein
VAGRWRGLDAGDDCCRNARTRRKVLDLVEAGRPIQQVAGLLGVSDQAIYNWRRQHLIDTGRAPGIASSENGELIAARRRIAELATELAIHRRATAPRVVSASACHRSAVASSISAGDPYARAAAGPAGPTACRSQSQVSAHVAAREHPLAMALLGRKARQRQLDMRASGSCPRKHADRSG